MLLNPTFEKLSGVTGLSTASLILRTIFILILLGFGGFIYYRVTHFSDLKDQLEAAQTQQAELTQELTRLQLQYATNEKVLIEMRQRVESLDTSLKTNQAQLDQKLVTIKNKYAKLPSTPQTQTQLHQELSLTVYEDLLNFKKDLKP